MVSARDFYLGPKGTPMRDALDPVKIPTVNAVQVDPNKFGFAQANQAQRATAGQTGQLVGVLQQQAAGNGPSVATAQMQQGMGQANNLAMGMAASARGADGALAHRGAAVAQSNNAMQAAQMGAQIRAQEQLSGQQQLGGVLQQQRLADLQASDQSLEQTQMQMQSDLQAQNINYGANKDNAQAKQKQAAGILGAGASVLGMLSDEKLKTNLREATPAYEGVRALRYKYKPGLGEPTDDREGVSAQDLERSPKFAKTVHKTPIGKQIDVSHALSIALAEGANLHARLKRLERQ